MAVGNFGAVIATTPLAWAADRWGWRSTFFMIGGITAALALFTLLKTRDHYSLTQTPKATPVKETATLRYSRSNVMRVLANRQFWVVGMIFFGFYGTILTLQGLWATPFLMSVLGIERIFASNLNMLIPAGVIVGAPLLGWLNDRFQLNKKQVLIGLLALNTLMWGAITFFAVSLGTLGISLVLLALGTVTGGFISTLWGIIRDITPTDIFGLTSGFLNPAPFFGVALFQLITGAILDKTGRVAGLYPASGFENAFFSCFVSAVICLFLAYFIKTPKEM
jgi:sugar phosphate permease